MRRLVGAGRIERAIVGHDTDRETLHRRVAVCTCQCSMPSTRCSATMSLAASAISLAVSRFFPRLADRIAARRVRELFRDEIETRRRGKEEPVAARV